MVTALRAAGVDLAVVDGLMPTWARGLEAGRRLASVTGAATWLWERERIVLRAHAARVAQVAQDVEADAVLSPGTLAVAELPPGRPVAVWTDATFAGLVDYYEDYSHLSQRSLRTGHAAERRALDRADLVVYTSQWAADSARDDYGADSSKLAVVPFGAAAPARPDEPLSFVAVRARGPVRMLFVGVDWKRKGADLAVAATTSLLRSGIDCTLDIVGCGPPLGTELPPQVTVHGFLRREEPRERDRLDQLFRDAAVLVVPSQAECFGLVYAEAAGWGLPVVAVRTGGVPSVVEDGVTGRLVAPPADGASVAAAVRELVSDPARYAATAVAARGRYDRHLTWRRAVDTLLSRVERMVAH